jgi:hypothetical protein
MLPWLAAVIQNVGIGATGFFQSISQDGHTVKGTLVVDALGYLLYRAVVPGEPSGVDGDGAKGKGADEIAEDGGLGGTLALGSSVNCMTPGTSRLDPGVKIESIRKW